MAMNWKALAAAVVAGIGAVSVVAGVALVTDAGALVIAGLILIAVGLLPDWGA